MVPSKTSLRSRSEIERGAGELGEEGGDHGQHARREEGSEAGEDGEDERRLRHLYPPRPFVPLRVLIGRNAPVCPSSILTRAPGTTIGLARIVRKS